MLSVDTTANIKPGDWVRLWLQDLDSTRGTTTTTPTSSGGDRRRRLLAVPRAANRQLPGSPDVLRQALAASLADSELTPAQLAALKRMAARAVPLADPAGFKRAGFHAAALDGTLVAW